MHSPLGSGMIPYSNVSRGKRKKAQPDGSAAAAPEVVEVSLFAPGRAEK